MYYKTIQVSREWFILEGQVQPVHPVDPISALGTSGWENSACSLGWSWLGYVPDLKLWPLMNISGVPGVPQASSDSVINNHIMKLFTFFMILCFFRVEVLTHVGWSRNEMIDFIQVVSHTHEHNFEPSVYTYNSMLFPFLWFSRRVIFTGTKRTYSNISGFYKVKQFQNLMVYHHCPHEFTNLWCSVDLPFSDRTWRNHIFVFFWEGTWGKKTMEGLVWSCHPPGVKPVFMFPPCCFPNWKQTQSLPTKGTANKAREGGPVLSAANCLKK